MIVDDVAQDAVTPVAGVMGDVGSTRSPENGKIDLQPMVDAQPTVAKATKTLAGAQCDADGIDTGGHGVARDDAVDQLRNALSSASEQAADCGQGRAAGAGDARRRRGRQYLLLFQNNAELRAGGGIPGAVALLDVRDGAIRSGQPGFGRPPSAAGRASQCCR